MPYIINLLISIFIILYPISQGFANPVTKQILKQDEWINSNSPIRLADLQSKLILLDFSSFSCIQCVQSLPHLQHLRKTFGKSLTIITVHSPQLEEEKNIELARQAVIKHGIDHLVIHDPKRSLTQFFNIRQIPTQLLITPDGKIAQQYVGYYDVAKQEKEISSLITIYKHKLNLASLPVSLEKFSTQPTNLLFPTKLSKSDKGLLIADSGHHRILELAPDGRILRIIGNGKPGYKDGPFGEAEFNNPTGILYRSGKLYIADTNNHRLRVADFSSGKVSTLAGTGYAGTNPHIHHQPALKTPIASPTDIAFYPNDNHLIIAMAGLHQLWSYNVIDQTLSAIAGNGKASLHNGSYPLNSLAQPNGLSAFGDSLFIIDTMNHALRMIKGNQLHTLVSNAPTLHGFKDGSQGRALMQSPLGLFADDVGIFIADSYNHAIRIFYPANGELTTYAGTGKKGLRDGSIKKAVFNSPHDLEAIGHRLYVTDTNNHRIRVIDTIRRTVNSFTIQAGLEQPITYANIFPNIEVMDLKSLKANTPITVSLQLKPGWKIHDVAPSYFALFENQTLVTGYNKHQLKDLQLTLPELEKGKTYQLQGSFYYCLDKDNAACLIKSINETVSTKQFAKKHIKINL